jgi:hypothetical protein
MIISLKDKNSGLVKNAKVGFSWTTLFFGFLPTLFREDWKWCAIEIVLAIVTCGISWLAFPFIYNKLYIKTLLGKGYEPADENSKNILQSKGIIA